MSDPGKAIIAAEQLRAAAVVAMGAAAKIALKLLLCWA